MKVEPDPIWTKDKGIWTSAGVSAGVDITLALIEEDHGVQVALEAARELCMASAKSPDRTRWRRVSAHLVVPIGPRTRVDDTCRGMVQRFAKVVV